MSLKEELANELDFTFSKLMKVIDEIDQEQINIIPFEESWTAGELLQHLIKSNSGFVYLLNGPATETEREPDMLAKDIKEGFLNFKVKNKSPEFVVPDKAHYVKENMVNSLTNIEKDLKSAVSENDLTMTYTAFEIPVLGYLTGLEIITFAVYHTQRHTHQLSEISKVLQQITEEPGNKIISR